MTDRRPRWEGDTSMAGMTDGRAMLSRLAELADEMRSEGWVSEDALALLGPSITAWFASGEPRPWRNVTCVPDAEWLDVSAEWVRPEGGIGDLRADVFALVGSFAEQASLVTQVRQTAGIFFEIATGESDGAFAAHGHLVRLSPTGRDVERLLTVDTNP